MEKDRGVRKIRGVKKMKFGGARKLDLLRNAKKTEKIDQGEINTGYTRKF